ncbi:MAG: hypothetical protein KF744_17260 [Taibaiella sp.]|nr:hypothetical protein [Taibaiella sp.]
MRTNFERMMEVVNETFDTRNDPEQVSVSPEEQAMLEAIHPATLSELANDAGPIVWILLIPTTAELMDDFLEGRITEKELLHNTTPGHQYDSVYLCSASVLPEFRGQGLAKKLTVQALERIRKDHPVKTLFYWPFTDEGKHLAGAVAKELGLKLRVRVVA